MNLVISKDAGLRICNTLRVIAEDLRSLAAAVQPDDVVSMRTLNSIVSSLFVIVTELEGEPVDA